MEATPTRTQDTDGTVSTPARRAPNPSTRNGYGPPPSDLKRSQDPSRRECGTVRKRNGEYEEMSISKIERKLKRLSAGLHVNYVGLATQVSKNVYDGIPTSEIDRLAASAAHEKITDHPDYDVLAARITVDNHQKETMPLFSTVMEALYKAGQLRDDFIAVVRKHADTLDDAIDYDRDNLFTYFGFRTFEQGYGLCVRETDDATGAEITRVYERPQHMWMRVAVALHLDDIDAAIESYNWMSCMYFTHASPTLMNAGKKRQQMSSCFLVAMKEEDHDKAAIMSAVRKSAKTGAAMESVEFPDSISKIYDTLRDCAKISASSGGIGLHCSVVRAEGSPINSAGRPGSGVLPMLRNFEAMANYVDQGRKRKGAVAVYMEPWHADVEDFLLIKENATESKEWKESGKTRMRDLHTALWIPDIFMERHIAGKDWSLMCPFFCPDLQDLYGEAFTRRYEEYEAMGAPYVRRTIKARELWTKIVDSQIHTGEPYMVYKDAVNRKTNHQNLGTIKSSNLCVAPYTKVLTQRGNIPIVELKDQVVKVWNGDEWSEVTVRQTGSNVSLIRVTLDNGAIIDCTAEHRFYIKNSQPVSDDHSASGFVSAPLGASLGCDCKRMLAAIDLDVADELVPWRLPGDKEERTARVVSVERIDGLYDTYCFSEPKRHLGTFEGVVTGQCSEIVQYSSSDKTAVCNLASVSLKSFVEVDDKTGEKSFDHDTLAYVVKMITRNLDRIIDINYYPTEEARNSNMSERPMGIGVQGLADAYIRMGYPYDSEDAAQLNREIFETIYYAAVEASCELSEEAREPYPTFAGSPMSQGRFQFDMWREEGHDVALSGRWDWDALKERVKKNGVRNSLLVALMPTASTSQLLGNNESFEPYTNNMYIRTVLSGSYKVVNRQMILDLIDMDLWTETLKNKIIAVGGDIQHVIEIPKRIRDLYKTSYGLSQKVILDQAADRGPFVDQSMSLNIHMGQPTLAKVTSMHVYGWKRGLKTGQYYLRSKPAKQAVAVTVDPTLEKDAVELQRELSSTVAKAEVTEVGEGNNNNVEGESDLEENYGGWVCRKEEGCVQCSG